MNYPEDEIGSNGSRAGAAPTLDANYGPIESEQSGITALVSDDNVVEGKDTVSSTRTGEADLAKGKLSNLVDRGQKVFAQIAAVKNALPGGDKAASSTVPANPVEGTAGIGENGKSDPGPGKGDEDGASKGDKKEGKNGKGIGDGKAAGSKGDGSLQGRGSDKDFVGLGAGSKEQQTVGATVQKAMSAVAGKKGGNVTISSTLTAEQWQTVFQSTGMYQGYDLDELAPTQSLKSLFVNSSEDFAGHTPRPGVPTKPCFLQMDTRSTSIDHANTQRRSYFVESGFRSADLSISVPYVAASVKADVEEKMSKEKETRTVFFTTKHEFPRCRIDIRSSVESGYLHINHDFLDEIREIWTTLKDLEKALSDPQLDGKKDTLGRRKLAQRDLDETARLEHDKAREKQRVEVQVLQHSVVAPMRDLIKRYGAVWVEEVTLGGKIFKTSKEKVQWDAAVRETAEKFRTELKASPGAGGTVGGGIEAGKAKKVGNEAFGASNQVNLQAVGGDTLLFNEDNQADWLDSVKDHKLWRIISLAKVRRLDELPGLEKYGLTEGSGTARKWSSDNSWGNSVSREQVVGMTEVVHHLLEIVANVTDYEEHVRKVPRRQLGSAWVNTLKGHWYGCYTWHKSLSFPQRPCIMTVTFDEPKVAIFSAKTLGVESGYLHQLRVEGKGKDDKGSFTITGVLQEVESHLRRVKDSAYEVLALVELRKSYKPRTQGSRWKGSETLKYAATRIPEDERSSKSGCLARFSGHNSLRADHNEGVILNALPTEELTMEQQADLTEGEILHAPVPPPTKELTKEQFDAIERESDPMGEGTWVYKGHLDRMGMHGYWAYQGRSEVGSTKQKFEQEGGTWTMAPIEELPKSEEAYVLPVFSKEELKKVKYNTALITDPSWKPLSVSPSDNAADLLALLQPTKCPHFSIGDINPAAASNGTIPAGPGVPALLQPTGCPDQSSGDITPAAASSGTIHEALRCEKCAAMLVKKEECGLNLRRVGGIDQPKFLRVLVAARELPSSWNNSMHLVGMEGMYLEVLPGLLAKEKLQGKKAENAYVLPVFSREELKKVSFNTALIKNPSWKPLSVSPSDNAADLLALLQPTGCLGHSSGDKTQAAASSGTIPAGPGIPALLQPTGCPDQSSGDIIPAAASSGTILAGLRDPECEKCAAVLVKKEECGLILRKAEDIDKPKFRQVLVASRELPPTWDKSRDLIKMKGMYLEVLPALTAKKKLLRKKVDPAPQVAPAKPPNAPAKTQDAPAKIQGALANPQDDPANPQVAPAKTQGAPAKAQDDRPDPRKAPAKPRKPRSLPSSDPDIPWSFVQPESEVNEPRRRWLLPPDEVLPESKRVERPLGVGRIKGEWHGYVLTTPLLPDPEDAPARSPADKTVPSIVLPSPRNMEVTTCRTLGGTVGNLKYLVEAKARPMSGSRLLTWKLRGTLIQLPLAEPLTGPAEHTYPILATVDLTETARFLGVRVPFMRKRFYKGHLDYLGMHGFHGRIGAAHLEGTFGLMPVRDVKEKPDTTEMDGAVPFIGATPAAAGGPRGLKCWPFRKTATPV